jgi:hypothetical protein
MSFLLTSGFNMHSKMGKEIGKKLIITFHLKFGLGKKTASKTLSVTLDKMYVILPFKDFTKQTVQYPVSLLATLIDAIRQAIDSMI